MTEAFETYWSSDEFVEYIDEKDYERLQDAIAMESGKGSKDSFSTYSFDIRPYPFQEAILDKLEAERKIYGNYKNLVVAATGTGKTVISALVFLLYEQQTIIYDDLYSQ